MAYDRLDCLNHEGLEEIKKVAKVFKPSEYHDVDIKEIYSDYNYIIEVSDYNVVIENSQLKGELEKIKKLKMVFEEINNEVLREKTFAEVDDLEETSDREILNRAMVRNVKARGLKIRVDDNIFFKNKEDESYNEIKSYYIDLTLSVDYNNDFNAIARRLKRAIASNKQSYTIFKAIASFKDKNKKYVVIIPEMVYNNERITKDIYKMFLPKTTWALIEICQIMIKSAQSWNKCIWWCVQNWDRRVKRLQSL